MSAAKTKTTPRSAPEQLSQATVRLRSEGECERVITLAKDAGVASAMAFEGPENGGRMIFVMILDEPERLEAFLPTLREAAPHAYVSVSHERALHVSPSDFLRGGALKGRSFRVEAEHLAWVFLGGAIGGGARVLVDTLAGYVTPSYALFPWGTLLVNVLGSLLISSLGTLLFERFVGERERTFWMLGFLGSLTTFSSFVLQARESLALSPLYGSLYVAASLALGLGAALLGVFLARRSFR